MDLTPLNYPKTRDTVVILGAGATRGAALDPPSPLVKPPLDTDFFQVLRSSQTNQLDDSRKLLEVIASEFGSLDISMERFYSQAYLFDQFVSEIPDGKRGRLRRYEQALKYFRRILPRVFGESLQGRSCKYHNRLANALHAGDTCISFNYDCVMDRALAPHMKRRWVPRVGYEFTITQGLKAWQDTSGYGPPFKRPFMMLKPHGSLNWYSKDGKFGLLENEYGSRSEEDLLIIPPLMQKSFEDKPFTAIWSRARQVLARTKALILIGYSLPETDVYTQAALRMDISSLDLLCVVNPDPAARERIHNTLSSAVRAQTHVVDLDFFRDFAELLPLTEQEEEKRARRRQARSVYGRGRGRGAAVRGAGSVIG